MSSLNPQATIDIEPAAPPFNIEASRKSVLRHARKCRRQHHLIGHDAWEVFQSRADRYHDIAQRGWFNAIDLYDFGQCLHRFEQTIRMMQNKDHQHASHG